MGFVRVPGKLKNSHFAQQLAGNSLANQPEHRQRPAIVKTLIGLFLFLVFFTLAGVVTHYAIYNRPGVFIWSIANGSIEKSRLKAEGPVLVRPQAEEKAELATIEEDTAESDGEVDGETDRTGSTQETVAEATEEKPGEETEPPADPNVIPLFNGKDLENWQITQYGGEGDVFVTEEGELEFGFGAILTGVHWDGDPPTTSNYEITLEAMKLDGTDFFCAVTFPVKESHATFVVGGWGGGIVGISSVDDLDASENETMNIEGFNEDVWYRIRVRVTDEKIEAWIDDTMMVDLELENRKISLRPGDIELSVPLGLSSFQTRAKYRNIVWKNLPEGQ